MIDSDLFLLFLWTSVVMLVVPGPAILFIVAESLARGRRHGVFAALGLTVGSGVHALAATAGLSALLASSAVAFSVVQYAGAAYLVFLGMQQIHARWHGRLQAKDRGSEGVAAEPRSPFRADVRRSFRRGLTVNVLNPKLALFFLALFPQFIDPAAGPVVAQSLALGAVFTLLTFLVDAVYALATGTAADLLRRRGSFRPSPTARAAGYLPGLLYLGLGVATAVASVER